MSIQGATSEGVSAADALLLALAALQGRVSTRLASLIATLQTDEDGKLFNTAANMQRLSVIIGEAKATMFDDEFIEELTEYLRSFDSITQDVLDAFEDFDDVEEEDAQTLGRAMKQSVAGYLTNPDSYGGSFWQPVTNAVILGVATSAVLSDTIESVNEVAGSGGLVTAVESEVVSSPIVLQRLETQAVAERVGAEFFLYQGRPIKTTRTFCAEREGRVWHIEEIRGWGRDASNGVDLDGNANPGWAGMVEGTNAQTIFAYLGGWYGGRNSCRHVLLPLPRISVPSEDLERMRSKGLIED
jgi:hypothetical protein